MNTTPSKSKLGFIGIGKMGAPIARRLIDGGHDLMLEVINAGTGRNNCSLYKMPRAVLTRTFDYGSNMEITYKDSCLCMKEAQRLGVTMLIGNMANQLWGYGVHRGGAKRDSSTLITYLEEWAGVQVAGAAARSRAQ